MMGVLSKTYVFLPVLLFHHAAIRDLPLMPYTHRMMFRLTSSSDLVPSRRRCFFSLSFSPFACKPALVDDRFLCFLQLLVVTISGQLDLARTAFTYDP